MSYRTLPAWLAGIDPALVLSIELGLEGDWSGSVKTVWTRETGLTPESVTMPQGELRPAAELYLSDGWLGVHCGVNGEGGYVVDQPLLNALIRFAESG